MELGNKRKIEILFYLEYGASFGHNCRRQMVLQYKKVLTTEKVTGEKEHMTIRAK